MILLYWNHIVNPCLHYMSPEDIVIFRQQLPKHKKNTVECVTDFTQRHVFEYSLKIITRLGLLEAVPYCTL